MFHISPLLFCVVSLRVQPEQRGSPKGDSEGSTEDPPFSEFWPSLCASLLSPSSPLPPSLCKSRPHHSPFPSPDVHPSLRLKYFDCKPGEGRFIKRSASRGGGINLYSLHLAPPFFLFLGRLPPPPPSFSKGIAKKKKRFLLLRYCYDRLQHEPARARVVDRRLGSEVRVSACNIKRQEEEEETETGEKGRDGK